MEERNDGRERLLCTLEGFIQEKREYRVMMIVEPSAIHAHEFSKIQA